MERLTDLESLVLSVRDPKSKENIREAINAYYGGAFRSSIIATWIAVTFDIIEKIKELAAYEDAQAKQLVIGLQEKTAQRDINWLSRFEQELLERACEDFELISREQKVALQRIKEDRNLCAHPAFTEDGNLFEPQAESVRSHIVHAVHDLLRHAPVRGKSSLKAIVEDIKGDAFPAAAEAAGQFLAKKYLEYARPSLKQNLLSLLIKATLKDLQDWAGYRPRAILALRGYALALPEIHDDWMRGNLARTVDQLSGNEMFRVFGLLSVDLRIWIWLAPQHRIQLREILEKVHIPPQAPFDQEIDGFVAVLASLGSVFAEMKKDEVLRELGVSSVSDLFRLMEIDDLEAPLMKIFSKLSETDQLSIISTAPSRKLLPASIKLYSGAGSFRHAERLGQAILVPLAPFVSKEDIRAFAECVLGNGQIFAAGGTCQILLSWLHELTKRSDINLAEVYNWTHFISELKRLYDSYDELEEYLVSAKLVS